MAIPDLSLNCCCNWGSMDIKGVRFCSIVKLNGTTGNIIWMQDHGGILTYVDWRNGHLWVSGLAGTGNFMLRKLNATDGVILTSLLPTNAPSFFVGAWPIGTVSDGGVYICRNGSTDRLRKYDSTGTLVWNTGTSALFTLNPRLIVGPDDELYISGNFTSPPPYVNMERVNANGTLAWNSNILGDSSLAPVETQRLIDAISLNPLVNDYLFASALDPAIGGANTKSGYFSRADGSLISDPGVAFAGKTVEVDTGGDFFGCNVRWVTMPVGEADFATLIHEAYSTIGGGWTVQLGPTSTQRVRDIAKDSGNNLIVSGDNGVKKFDSSGTLLWHFLPTSLNPLASVTCNGIAIDDDDNVYACTTNFQVFI